MNPIDRFQTLPPRLRRAVWIWLGLAPVVALFSDLCAQSVGVLVHPAFWCGLLPLMALAPHWRLLVPAADLTISRPRRASGRAQARRRVRGRQTARLAA